MATYSRASEFWQQKAFGDYSVPSAAFLRGLGGKETQPKAINDLPIEQRKDQAAERKQVPPAFPSSKTLLPRVKIKAVGCSQT